MSERDQFTRRRADLVELLEEKGITDRAVLDAISTVPRHKFLDDALQGRAYEDEALPIGLHQTISQPFTVAYQTELLATTPGERILEIGTGSGYQAAVLATLGVQLFSIERLRPLYERTRQLLRDLGYRVTCRLGDGTQGWEAMGPFDGIIVTAGAVDIPRPLLEQLKLPEVGPEGSSEVGPGSSSEVGPGSSRDGGRLIIPVGGREGQSMYRITRTGVNDYEREQTHGFRFVPLIPD